MLRGQGPVAASFQGPWENMQPPYASLRGQRGAQDLKIMLRIHALRAGAGSVALLARLILLHFLQSFVECHRNIWVAREGGPGSDSCRCYELKTKAIDEKYLYEYPRA
jgi:hypothetical protein